MSSGEGGLGAARTVLAIDTATDSVVTGVVELTGDTIADVRVLAERVVTDHRRHAELLTTLIAECLAESGISRDSLAAVVVGCGPGPFTGLRVGMATGAAFADALGIPAHGVCSLDALNLDTTPPGEGSDVLVVTDARRREVYWALYRDGARVRGPEVTAPATVAEELSPVFTAGEVGAASGSASHLELVGWTGAPPQATVPSARGLVAAAAPAIIAGEIPEPLVPLYLRRPDAVEQKARKLGAAR
ncbi:MULTISPECIES: tRNA (adenosine(37)-N6)-threonylcarbamoyltransferase complex dimerization subunit type 1 TsaB [Gordonia]|jgi:tRNA threonylcarbamoyl adenosine modification protein YeaZ|uniref:tRNA (adenosine(37)-N6)-threonylcarbamoyltransferase complex dimerization subunit type 1 TsaB n=1 Tax=Gordonia TaxID=2053 RepID=UPI00096285F5|nr:MULTISPECIES: tRNA (adenosine(37)-N6)-threonylcarbamoyltransferase complex dimerization subunit type 1 TsaB [Gordonia]AZZ82948.1 tRNA (adenosine(37)-N6)-threonylcarbamoyltransferase complex dimerization subunit type 1 TsaB [Gordonia alkanivorans]MDH3010310.1 tRNA (adenosine(37)-N6)-threonylcarbamoyltransferase complex dimerization subunit type 1 TsaB [Gordonia alkanivorans]OLT49739.1 tRNA (adenosine(37)-N6)-threonylcarbamoyltransferase complex dimerization subunit type 1 TsaB [Gordonia sp. CN